MGRNQIQRDVVSCFTCGLPNYFYLNMSMKQTVNGPRRPVLVVRVIEKVILSTIFFTASTKVGTRRRLNWGYGYLMEPPR